MVGEEMIDSLSILPDNWWPSVVPQRLLPGG